MEKGVDYDKNDDRITLIRLLIDQQREIRGLIEDLAKDITHLKELTRDVPILCSQVDFVKKELDSEKRLRSECQNKVDKNFFDLNSKRDLIKDKVSELENDLKQKIFDGFEKLRYELELKLESKIKSTLDSIKDIQNNQIKPLQDDIKKLTGEASKAGGVIALVTSLVLYLIKTVYDHLVSK